MTLKKNRAVGLGAGSREDSRGIWMAVLTVPRALGCARFSGDVSEGTCVENRFIRKQK